MPTSLVSSALLLAGVAISLWYWSTKKQLTEEKLLIAFGGLVGAFIGAKLGYVLAEGLIWWHDPMFWLRMLVGKTILGGLLGGWWGVEWAKRVVGESRIMGDDFARIIPVGISLGRVGCWSYGCCPGRPLAELLPPSWVVWWQAMGVVAWPAPLVEIAFQVTFFASTFVTKDVRWLKGQQFHVYLMTYGVFRAFHEHFRGTVRYEGMPVSPYTLLAALVAVCGFIAFVRRSRSGTQSRPSDSP